MKEATDVLRRLEASGQLGADGLSRALAAAHQRLDPAMPELPRAA